MSAHYFLAIAAPPKVAGQINQWVKANKQQYPFKGWVHAGDYHITLAFLGHAEQEPLQELIQRLPQTISDEYPFPLELNQFGIFGQPERPRVFFADLKKQTALSHLQQKVAECCQKSGFVLEKRPYHPHLTIARKWAAEHVFALPNFISEIGGNLVWEAKEVTLFQTYLDQLPKYQSIAQFPLGT
jgi:RNA 2',3'-cyclic 3'-phosphodiesterase